MTENYLCIHGHFHQPPRENPWLGFIEHQPSALPFHDWNERITRECYGPNTRARITGQGGKILKLVNNYEYMSFNFSPTLLSWLEKYHPWVYSRILEADKKSQARNGGHGNAIAQVYNHIIMPLANRRDKITQIRWGIHDFRKRFKRNPEGMWLAETAVDMETLDIMSDEGIKFTILCPNQGEKIRLLYDRDDSSWIDVSNGRIDPKKPYRVKLSQDRFIDIFFYDSPISRAVAFEKLLSSGENFLARIKPAFDASQPGPQLLNLATDGESYGHHFKFGDMALAWLFNHLEQNEELSLINYGYFLEKFPPLHEVRIIENSSWSCIHGVERWRSDCGCRINNSPGSSQVWRRHLREGVDWLASELSAIFEKEGSHILNDPWQSRNNYIEYFDNADIQSQDTFLKNHITHPDNIEEKTRALELLESQRMALYMFTSCGWFFDDISGLEATQILKYAVKAIDLAGGEPESNIKKNFQRYINKCKSNDPAYKNGRDVYMTHVIPAQIDPSRAAAHFAISALMKKFRNTHPAGTLPDPTDKTATLEDRIRPVNIRFLDFNDIKGALGVAEITELMTGRKIKRIFGVFLEKHWAPVCMVAKITDVSELDSIFDNICKEISCSGENLKKIIKIIKHFLAVEKIFALNDLCIDTLRNLASNFLESLRQDINISIQGNEGALKGLLSILQTTGENIPEILCDILRLMFSGKMENLTLDNIARHHIDLTMLRYLATKGDLWRFTVNNPVIKQKMENMLIRMMDILKSAPGTIVIDNIISVLDLAQELKVNIDPWKIQNQYHDMDADPLLTKRLNMNITNKFRELGSKLGFSIKGEV